MSKSFAAPDGTAAHALAGVSFEVRRGDFVGIVGSSGCGKSTLLQIMGGLQHASAGQVFIGDREVTKPPFEVIYVFQDYSKSLFPWKTVEGNVAFGIENRGVGRAEVRARCQRYLELVGLQRYGRYHPWQLSGGMQQRVAIARALACEPQVLLMDEPFSSVDALTRATLQDLVLEIWTRLGLTIIFITHDTEEVIYLSNRVLVMTPSPGRIREELEIVLPYPRDQLTTRESDAYLRYRHEVLAQLVSQGGARRADA